MNFYGRWVPLELMNLIVGLWLIAATIIGVLLYRIRAKEKQPRQEPRSVAKATKRRGNRKKKS